MTREQEMEQVAIGRDLIRLGKALTETTQDVAGLQAAILEGLRLTKGLESLWDRLGGGCQQHKPRKPC